MNKPQGYDEAQSFGEFETLPAGGYKCLIKNIENAKTINGKEYLKIVFDIAEGEYKDFYEKKFKNDTRNVNEKKWSGIWTVFIEGYEPNTTNSKFKGLITSIEKSNSGFKFDWNEQTLINKKIGLVFREEEFKGQDGKIHTGVKPFYAIDYDKTEEVKIPTKKELSDDERERIEDNYFSPDSYDDSDDLPF